MCPTILEGGAKWETLWEPADLFTEFKQFVQITCRAPSPADISAFSGLVQSTLRVFVSGFPPDFHAVPFPKAYDIPRTDEVCVLRFLFFVFYVFFSFLFFSFPLSFVDF
jgi:poly(A) polymerase Pap1